MLGERNRIAAQASRVGARARLQLDDEPPGPESTPAKKFVLPGFAGSAYLRPSIDEAERQRAAQGAARSLQSASVGHIVNHMVQYSGTHLDASFAALSDATRRGVLEQLVRADASITDLAEKFRMTLTGMKKHVGVLEKAGLVTTEKVGRVRNCKLGLRRLEEEAMWLERYRQLWEARFDELDMVVEELKRKEKVDGRRKK
jgi:DNA-binding transcriptional ArsR family regulator